MVVLRVLTGALLLAHGLVHLLYLAPDVDAFSTTRSWLLPQPALRPVAHVLIGTTVVAFVLVALSVWGLPGLSPAWPLLTLVAAAVSALLLVAFWDRQLVVGLAIDVCLLALALTRPEWVQQLVEGRP